MGLPNVEPPWTLDADARLRADDITLWRTPWQKTRSSSWFDYPNPIIAGDMIVAGVRSPGSVHAVDMATGQRRWVYETDRNLSSAPLVVGSVVLAQTSKRLIALDLASGQRRWETGTLTPGELSTALVAADELIFVGSSDGKMRAFEIGSRKLVWRHSGLNRINGWPVIFEDRLIFGTNGGFVYAFETGTGKPIWKTEVGEPIHTTGGYVNGLIQLESPFFLYGLSSEGKIETEWHTEGRQVRAAVTDGKQTFVRVDESESLPIEGGPEGMRYTPTNLLCLAEGEVQWSVGYPPYASARLAYSPITGYLYEATQAGLGIVDPNTGNRRWAISNFGHKDGLPTDTTALPAVTPDRLYLLTDDGSVVCLRHPR